MFKTGIYGLIALLGAYIIIVNWLIVWYQLTGKKSSSWVPLIGGLLTAIGLSGLPVEGIRNYFWVPLLVDYGCAPGLLHTAWYYLRENRRKNEER